MHTMTLQPRARKTVSPGAAPGRKAVTAVTAITQVTPEDPRLPKTYTATVVRTMQARAEVTFEATGPVNSWDLAEALKGRLTDADFGAPVASGDLWVERVEEAELGEKAAGRALRTKSDDGDVDWQAYVSSATSLDDLLDRINECDQALSDREANPTGTRVTDVVDMTSLPTFGGQEPADTIGVWSWDESRLLVGEGNLEIVDRADWT